MDLWKIGFLMLVAIYIGCVGWLMVSIYRSNR
jgi:hypothetical protein